MNTKKMADYVAEQCNYPKRKTRKIINTFFHSVFKTLLNGESIVFRHFGRFYLTQAQERKAFDPYKKVMFTLPKHTRVRFSASKKIKDIIKSIEVK